MQTMFLMIMMVALALFGSVMVTRDLKSRNAMKPLIAPAVKNATITPAQNTGIDTQGYSGVQVVVNTGALVGSAIYNFQLVESDDNTVSGGGWTNVDPSQVNSDIGTSTAAAANSTYRLGYMGTKRYIDLKATLVSGTSLAFGAVAHLGLPQEAPV